MTSNPDTSKPSSSRNKVIVVVVAVVVAALAVALFVGGSDDSGSGGSLNGSAGGDAVQNQAVGVTGTPLAPMSSPTEDPALGEMAPTLNGSSFDGTAVSVVPGDGRPYMVVFLAHWCPHCNAEIPQLIEWKESGSVPDDLQVIGISTSVASDRPNYPPSQWIVDKGWPWEIMADSAQMDAATAYGVTGFPFFAIIGEDGTVRLRVSGEVEAEILDRIVRTALGRS